MNTRGRARSGDVAKGRNIIPQKGCPTLPLRSLKRHQTRYYMFLLLIGAKGRAPKRRGARGKK